VINEMTCGKGALRFVGRREATARADCSRRLHGRKPRIRIERMFATPALPL